VSPLLKQLAAGAVVDADILAAVKGVLHASPAVRAAALGALPSLPAFAAGQVPVLQDGTDELVGGGWGGVCAQCGSFNSRDQHNMLPCCWSTTRLHVGTQITILALLPVSSSMH
jgi:hypothetical protein